MTQSCLVAKLSHYLELSPSDRELLLAFEENERTYPAGQDVYRDGEYQTRLRVVKNGWFYSYTILPDGRRFIFRVHQPGDILGFSDVAFVHTTSSLRSVNGGVLCPFPRAGLHQVFARSPRLAALLFSIAVRDQVLLVDQQRTLARMSAGERLAHFLLDLAARLRVTGSFKDPVFTLPLNQGEIGDMVGLTNVHVSRTFRALEEEGLITRDGNRVTLLDEARLRKLCDFVDRYATLDATWFDVSRLPTSE